MPTTGCTWMHSSSRSMRAAQGALGRDALAGVAAHRLVEDDDRGAAALLGAVHRRVRVADEVLGPRSAARDRDADARLQERLAVLDEERLLEQAGDPAGDGARARLAVDVLAQDRELVAAEPGDRVGRAQRVAQARRDVAQQRSPAAWPKESLMSLKRSRSTNSTATPPPSRLARRSACSRRSRNSARFGSPVSVSCSAWCASRDSASLRSDTSRVTATTWCGVPLASGTMRAAVSTQRTDPSGRTTRHAPVAAGRRPATTPTSSSPIGPASSGWMKPTSAAVRPTSSSGR